jgi:hypothetical protein
MEVFILNDVLSYGKESHMSSTFCISVFFTCGIQIRILSHKQRLLQPKDNCFEMSTSLLKFYRAYFLSNPGKDLFLVYPSSSGYSEFLAFFVMWLSCIIIIFSY